MDLRNRMLSLHENKRLVGTVVEVVENIVAVRVGRRLITGLPVVGQSVVAGQLVYVDYTTGEPAVYAWYQRGVASTAATVTRSVNRRIISDGLVGATAAPSAHTHDDRYYTESEVDTALAGKSDTGHTHTESEITDLDHTDAAALHEDVAGEIHALAEKTSPAAADELVIEDSADGYAKKRVQISNLPTGSGGATSFTDLDDVPTSYTGLGGQYLRVKSSEDGLETGSPAGSGDMTKAVYDQDDDGKVDAAEAADSVPWTGVTDKPTAFPAEAHTHDAGDIDSTGASDGQVLTADGLGGAAWKTPTGGAGTLGDLTDVTISNPSSGQVLKYNGSAWVNGTDATGEGGGGGDMAKATYDQDDDGIVDAAEAAPWSGITNKPDIETVSGEIVIGQDTEIHGDLTVTGAIHGSVPWAGVTDKPSTFPPEAHTHDDRYYTETEVDTALSGKSDTAHTHDDRYHTKTALATPNSGATVDYTNIANVPPSGAGGDLVNPMTTAGDIIIGVSTGSPARLGIGAEGQVLTVVNGMPAWADAPTGTGGEAFATIDPEIQQEFSETFSDSGVPIS